MAFAMLGDHAGRHQALDWNVGDSVMECLVDRSPISWVGFALNAFSEAEGWVGVDWSNGPSRRIFIRSVNWRGLVKIKSLFYRLRIETKLYSYPKTNCLIISRRDNLERFRAIVGFTSKRKQAKLKEILYSYKR